MSYIFPAGDYDYSSTTNPLDGLNDESPPHQFDISVFNYSPLPNSTSPVQETDFTNPAFPFTFKHANASVSADVDRSSSGQFNSDHPQAASIHHSNYAFPQAQPLRPTLSSITPGMGRMQLRQSATPEPALTTDFGPPQSVLEPSMNGSSIIESRTTMSPNIPVLVPAEEQTTVDPGTIPVKGRPRKGNTPSIRHRAKQDATATVLWETPALGFPVNFPGISQSRAPTCENKRKRNSSESVDEEEARRVVPPAPPQLSAMSVPQPDAMFHDDHLPSNAMLRQMKLWEISGGPGSLTEKWNMPFGNVAWVFPKEEDAQSGVGLGFIVDWTRPNVVWPARFMSVEETAQYLASVQFNDSINRVIYTPRVPNKGNTIPIANLVVVTIAAPRSRERFGLRATCVGRVIPPAQSLLFLCCVYQMEAKRNMAATGDENTFRAGISAPNHFMQTSPEGHLPSSPPLAKSFDAETPTFNPEFSFAPTSFPRVDDPYSFPPSTSVEGNLRAPLIDAQL